MDEAAEIQRRIKTKTNTDKTEANQKAFVNLMLLGKLRDAAKKINNDDSIKGVHSLDDNIKAILQKKHPKRAWILRKSNRNACWDSTIFEVGFRGIMGDSRTKNTIFGI